MRDSGWWTDGVIVVLAISAFLLICKGGFLYTYVVWGLYLAKGWSVVKKYTEGKVRDEFAGQVLLGIIVCVISTVIQSAAMFKY